MELIEEHFKFPDSKEELLKLVGDYLDDNPGLVMEIDIKVGEPVTFKRLWKEGSISDPRPYDILRKGSIENYSGSPSGTLLEILAGMILQLRSYRCAPVCFLIPTKELLDDLGDEYVLGYEVIVDDQLAPGTIIVAGGNSYGGIWGLSRGVVHTLE